MAFIQTSPYKGLEKYVMTKLFSRTFASVPEDAKIDREVSEKICLLQTFLKPEHLDIPAVLHNEASWLLAEKELQKINTFKAPQASPTLQGQTDPTPTRMHDKEEDTSGGSNYPYMDAEAGELTVGDVERLLSLYKDVVTNQREQIQKLIIKEKTNNNVVERRSKAPQKHARTTSYSNGRTKKTF
ncbi:hypothetical protein CMV_027675 [Castanea mollissima]|uniref:Uncharacterized protein n=1 Tax=Castanea mollissima TaxID=60419 RepID=A0A8J4QHS8_9ROSI|nr:hypothetical protein CMV_027675 [Castanea mollissima]